MAGMTVHLPGLEDEALRWVGGKGGATSNFLPQNSSLYEIWPLAYANAHADNPHNINIYLVFWSTF